ncbi:MAG: T9SS type A sorting domain-containing protein [Chitinophagaceae bacterium]|nr:MAG: T9SS type A sorting domain-containing protein [Chitinophagaceae bacterium]
MNIARINPGSFRIVKTLLVVIILTINLSIHAQVIGSWNFTNTISGIAGSFNTVSSADFSPAVPTRAFNGGTEYYGHDGWPTGGIDASYFLSFTLSPNAGYALNILSMNLRMRHSNTGSSGGSGPTQFTLRSNLDGYTANIATGSLTGSYSNFIITPGPAYNNLPTPVTFRIYGHNAVMYSGGNNRLVFDNIQVDAIGLILPVKLLSFKAITDHNNVVLEFTLNDLAAMSHLAVERSADNRIFHVIASEQETSYQSTKLYSYTDHLISGALDRAFYRLRVGSPGGKFLYSDIVKVKITNTKKTLTVIYSRGGLNLRGLLPGSSQVWIYSCSGALVFTSRLPDESFTHTLSNLPSLTKGIYYLKVSGKNGVQTSSFLSE